MPVISRPLLIALAAAVVAVVAFYATQGAQESSETVAPVVPAETVPEGEGAVGRGEGTPAMAAKPDATPSLPTAKRVREDAGSAARRAAAAKSKARRRARAERRGMPMAVARALRARKTVVIYFRGSESADDRATARAVAGLRGRRGVAVFADRIGRLGRYRAVVGDLGIAQAPAVVIVGRGRSARVVEGYIDPTTLAQDVADAR